uniref:helix-turn-helix domain-containing protein n=1 Tax=Streptomyces liliiviolaceus TaxID=2823109 RepID=UPI001FFD6214|nr:helix-turn-helix domain-containing protein [Streptomyces liliiviolaceus]
MSRSLAAGESTRQLAERLGRSPSTVSREIARNGGGTATGPPRPMQPSTNAGPASSKLAQRPALRALVKPRWLCAGHPSRSQGGCGGGSFLVTPSRRSRTNRKQQPPVSATPHQTAPTTPPSLREAAVRRLRCLRDADSLTRHGIRTVATAFSVHWRTVRRSMDNADAHNGTYTPQRPPAPAYHPGHARRPGSLARQHQHGLPETEVEAMDGGATVGEWWNGSDKICATAVNSRAWATAVPTNSRRGCARASISVDREAR